MVMRECVCIFELFIITIIWAEERMAHRKLIHIFATDPWYNQIKM